MELPSYLEGLNNFLPDFLVELFEDVEKSFSEVNYTEHIDPIYQIVNFSRDEDIEDLKIDLQDIYIKAIADCLQQQGLVINYEQSELIDIIKFFNSFIPLASNKVQDLLQYNQLCETTSEDLLAEVLFEISGLDHHTTHTLVKSISPFLVNYLVKATEVGFSDNFEENVRNQIVENSIKRVKESKLLTQGMITYEFIRSINKFGFSIDVALEIVSQDLYELKDPNEIYNEVKTLVLASNTTDLEISIKISQIVEHVFQDKPELMVRTLSLIDRENKDLPK